MPSNRYVAISPKGRLQSFSETVKNNQMVGGEVPLLLKNLIKTPISGAGINDTGKSNIMVGMITTPSTSVSSKVRSGGELLNNLQNLKFGKGKANRKDANIRFVF
jgi:hypothetical protein